MTPLIELKRTILIPIISFALACFALSPTARAVCREGCDTTNRENTFLGDDALVHNTTGLSNTAIGYQALFSNIDGFINTANGAFALYYNTFGSDNTATGYGALYRNTTGIQNTANGSYALSSNTLGHDNTATGYLALSNNTTGIQNTANGSGALESNRTGFQNMANGVNALDRNSTGYRNTANGVDALISNRTGNRNTADGFQALYNNTGSDNVGLGFNAGYNLTTGSNNIDIGAFGAADESNTIRIGRLGIQTKAFMQGIHGATVASGATVIVGSDGRLGTINSSARFKDEIKPMDTASEAILALKPVTFRYKKEVDPEGIPQFGLVAEDVEKVDPDLVVRDAEGKVYTVRYEAVNAMMLNEFLKEHRTVQELKSVVAKQEAAAAQQQKQIEALTAGLQRVSALVETSRTAPQMVNNP
jgi:uncharacterized coiled-coil protein SlyX